MRSAGLGVLVVADVDNQHVEFHAAEYAIAHYPIAAVNFSPQPWH
jgi:hypothetical protein